MLRANKASYIFYDQRVLEQNRFLQDIYHAYAFICALNYMRYMCTGICVLYIELTIYMCLFCSVKE